MKTILFLALLASTAAADGKKKIDVNGQATLVLGTSIGPFKLGMTRAEIDKLGVPQKNPATSIIVSGPYEIGLDKDDKVQSISRRMATDSDGKELKAGVLFGGKTIEPKISFADLQKRIPGCKAPDVMEGGNVAKCDNNTSVYAAGPVGVVGIAVSR